MDGSPSVWWWLALAGCAAAHLFVAAARVAFRLLGPVTIEALVDRIGADRTEFLRKSLRAPTALWFSLSLANGATLLALLVVLFAAGSGPVPEGWAPSVAPTGGALHDLGLYLVLLAALALVEFVLPILISRIDRAAFVEATLPVIRVIHAGMSPLSNLLERWSEAEDEDGDEEAGDEEVEAYITVGTREGILEESDGDLLRNVLLFGETRVREVMTPRTDVVGIESTATVRDVVELMTSTRYSRIPLYEKSLDEIVGLVSLKDAVETLQGGRAEEVVTSLSTTPMIVPESKRVSELLRDMQARRQALAVVADEYGGTAGIVTIEDLLEELVGEIREEHEEGEDLVHAPDGTWLVRGRASLHDVGEALGADLETDDGTATVGGLLLQACDRVPTPGEIVEHAGFRFAVEEADRRRVLLVRIARAEPAGSNGVGAEREGVIE